MAKNQETENLPQVYDYGDDAGVGLEHAPPPPLPQLKIVQGRESEFKKPGSQLEHASEGQLLHTGTGGLYEAIQVQVCYVNRLWLAWEGKQPTSAPPKATFTERPTDARWSPEGGLYLPNGDYVVENRTFYLLAHTGAGSWEPCVLHMNKTAIKESSEWLRHLYDAPRHPETGQRKRPPAWARTYVLTTRLERNEMGTWYAFRVMPGEGYLPPDGLMYREASEFYKIAAQHAEQQRAMGAKGAADIVVEDDVPF